jgi:hypothetical protein
MLKAYIDDSCMNQPPVYVLAGWIASAKVWAPFSDAWQEILWMKPRIEYFKYHEAMNLSGQFSGISEERRNEKLSLLYSAIKDHRLHGLSCIIPHDVFQPLFGNAIAKHMRNPYLCAFYGIIRVMNIYCDCEKIDDKVEFVFDHQPGEQEEAQSNWQLLLKVASPEFRKRLHKHPPSFLSDSGEGGIVALQAADLAAGYKRTIHACRLMRRRHPPMPWMVATKGIMENKVVLDGPLADHFFKQVYGFEPLKTNYGYVTHRP